MVSLTLVCGGQTHPASLSNGLPDQPAVQPAQSAPTFAAASAHLSGKVTDLTGAIVPAAHITLTSNGTVIRTATADNRGDFKLDGLTPGFYRVNVTAAGMGTYVSARLRLEPGEALNLSEIRLAIGVVGADVEVTATEEQVAQEQVKEAEQQRAFGVLPNFYSSYIWDAAPLNTRQKFGLALHSSLDPFVFVGTGIVAGVQQARNTYPDYGSGLEGYGKRYGAQFGDRVAARMIGSAILPSLLHQDPRYFYKGSGTVAARAFYAVSTVVVTRGDSGHRQPNYSYVAGAFASGAISNLYRPDANRGLGLVVRNGFINIGLHAADQLIREFVLRRVTPNVPVYKIGQPPEEKGR